MRKQIFTYSIITYTITWIIAFGIYALLKKGELTKYQLNFYHSFAAIGPTIGALITTYLFYGKGGLKKLTSKIRFQTPTREAVIFILSPLLFFILGLFVYRMAKQEWYSFQAFFDVNWSSFKVILVWLLPLLTYSIFEEIGWRGFLLPLLQQKYNAWIAPFT